MSVFFYGSEIMYRKILNILKADNSVVSGEYLANALGVSRAAVWKSIDKLRQMGYDIESVKPKGYRLTKTDVLSAAEFGEGFIYYDECTSTNNIAKELAHKGAKEGTVVTCGIQNSGKGRMGRVWQDKNGDGVAFSVILRPNVHPSEAPCLTLLAGVAAADVLRAETAKDIGIKWPNDLVLEGKKLSGILTEMSAETDRTEFVVVGVGINVNNTSFPKDINAISLKMACGKEFSRADIIKKTSARILELYKDFEQNRIDGIVEHYNELCVNKKRFVRVLDGANTEGVALGINNKGELLVETEKGIISVFSGEVSLRGEDGKYI